MRDYVPVFLFAFANDQHGSLRLAEEERAAREALMVAHDQQRIEFHSLGHTSLEDIYRSFNRFHNRVAIFHYGGHSDAEFLALEGGHAHAGSLSTLIGMQQGLQLVFLNGCANQAQVSELFARGVKTIIATSAPVDDLVAFQLSKQFYEALAAGKTIREAFATAASFVRHQKPELELKTRDFTFSDSPDVFPWALYHQEGVDISWTIPASAGHRPASTPVVSPNLLNRVPSSNSIFVGYREELSFFGEALQRYSLIAIEGVGGIGKTEFAIACKQRFFPAKESIIWVPATTGFDVMLQQAGYGEILKLENLDETQKFKSFETLLDRDEMVLFLEDFQDMKDDSYLRFLNQLSLRKAKIIVITRFLSADLDPGATIHLEGLKQEALEHARNQRHRSKNYRYLEDGELEILCREVDGHPLAIELGMQLLSYGESAKDILGLLSGEYSEHRKVEELNQRLLAGVLANPNTSPRERELLLRFSVFRGPVPFEAVQAIAEVKSIRYALSQLIEKSLIRFQRKLYETSPVIREFCLKQLDNSEMIHGLAANYYLAVRSKAFDVAVEENIVYHLGKAGQLQNLCLHLVSVGGDLIQSGQFTLLTDTIQNLREQSASTPQLTQLLAETQILKGELTDALVNLDSARSEYRQSGDRVGEADVLRLYGLFYEKSDLSKAIGFLERSLELAHAEGILELIVKNHIYLGSLSADTGAIDKGLEYVEEGLELAAKLTDVKPRAALFNVRGKIFRLKNDLKTSLAMFRKSYELYQSTDNKLDLAIVSNNIGILLNRLQQPQKALEQYEKSLRITEVIGDRSLLAADIYYNMGSALRASGRVSEALGEMYKSLEINRSIGQEFGQAYSLYGIGQCCKEIGKLDLAADSFHQSLAICEKNGYTNGQLSLYFALAETEGERRQYESATTWILHYFSLGNKIKRPVNGGIDFLAKLKLILGSSFLEELVRDRYAQLPAEVRDHLDFDQLL